MSDPVPQDRLDSPIDYPPRQPRRRRVGLVLFVLIILLWITSSSAVSYYVDALWFDARLPGRLLEVAQHRGRRLPASRITFVALYGAFLREAVVAGERGRT